MHPPWKRLDLAAGVSTLVCGGLVFIGIVRILSYSATNPLSIRLRASWLGCLAYQPDVFWSVRFFKLIATPVLVALIYFVFRALNHGQRIRLPGYEPIDRRIDFESPWLRLVLTTVATLHWVPLEYMKFTSDDFYPSSALEDLTTNVVVLVTGGLLSFFAMRRLSFDPLFHEAGGD
jgi:hypothetical protein